MKKHLVVFGILVFLTGCQSSGEKKTEEITSIAENNLQQNPMERSVEGNTLTSIELPEIKIKVDEEFRFLGKFDFEIIASSNEYPDDIIGKPVAAGERLIFAVVDNANAIEKLFIVQFEGFLSTNDFIYNYNFDNADLIGKNKYRHNTWFYDGKQSAKENPQGEGAKTQSFLKEKGLFLEDHLMMSRFVGLASEDRKNEIIIFYYEMLKKSTGYSLDEWENSISRKKAISIDSAFVERSKKSFSIIKG